MKFIPKGIVIHTMGRYIDSGGDEMLYGPDYLKSIKLGANAYLDTVTNEIIDGWPEGFYTPHAGVSLHKEKNIKDLNNHYIGIEIMIDNANNYSQLLKQLRTNPHVYDTLDYQLLAKYCKERMDKYGFDTSFIVAHEDVSGDDIRGKGEGKPDPGKYFDWPKLFGYIAML